MHYTVEKLTGNKVKITFNVLAADFETAVEKAYLKNRGSVNVPGFRKGKAPRRLIERMYGDTVFFDDALELIFPDAYMEAVQKETLHPVSQPQLHLHSMEKGKDVEFCCEIFVHPEVKLGQYKGMDVTRIVRPVSQAEVDERLSQEQKRVARSIEVLDRPVENGDEVNLDYSGSVDGVKFEGGTAQGQTLLIGSGNFIPGFEEQLIGLSIGQEKDVMVTFPEEYHAEELKGKAAVFHVKVNTVNREELPALDDEFASEVSEFDTLSAFTEDIRAKLQETADMQATETAKQSLVQQVVEAAEVDLPEPMVEEKLNEVLGEMNWRMQQQGFDMKRYMQLTGQTEAQMRDMYREQAKNTLKTELVMEEILKAEQVEADAADVDTMITEYAKAMNKTSEQVKADFTDAQLDYFTHRSKINKVLDMLWDSAEVTDEAVKAEAAADTDEPSQIKKPAKKPAAKKAAKKTEGDESAAIDVAEKAPFEKSVAKKTAEKPKAEKAKTTVKKKATADEAATE